MSPQAEDGDNYDNSNFRGGGDNFNDNNSNFHGGGDNFNDNNNNNNNSGVDEGSAMFDDGRFCGDDGPPGDRWLNISFMIIVHVSLSVCLSFCLPVCLL